MNDVILSTENRFIKHVLKLLENKNYRQEYQLGVLYGETIIAEADKYNLITDIMVKTEDYEHYKAKFINDNIHWHLVENDQIFKKLNVLNINYNLLALISKAKNIIIDDFYNQNCIILDQIQDPGNLGTIFRTAQAAGINNIIISKNSVDAYNPKVLRATMGMQFRLQVLQNVDLHDFLTQYNKANGTIVCCTTDSKRSIYQHNFKNYKNTGLLFGNEGHGISKELLDQYLDDAAYIPMHESSESLNIAIAVAITSYELYRQLNN